MDSFIETFHIDWQIVIAQVINFAVILFILQFLALKPLSKLMKERSESINKGLSDAKKNEEILKNSKEEYEKILLKAKTEANEIFQNGKKEAEEKRKEIIDNTNKEIENIIANSKKTLESEKIKMVEEAKSEIVSLVVKATEKLLESQNNEILNKK